MIIVGILNISSFYVKCIEGHPHELDTDKGKCRLCNKSMADLWCPGGRLNHEKVYAHTVEIVREGMRRPWICRLCYVEGTDAFPDAQEYAILRAKKMNAMARDHGELTARIDSPIPDVRTEYYGAKRK